MPELKPLTDADRAELVAYLDGELDADGQQRVEARLGRDPHARAEADTLRRAWELLDYLPRPEPSSDFTERTLTRISAAPAAREIPNPKSQIRNPKRAFRISDFGFRISRAAVWAAAVLVSVALGYGLTPPPRPTPPPDLDTDRVFAQEPRLIVYLPLYLAVENIHFLLALDRSDLYDDDTLAHYGFGDINPRTMRRMIDSQRRARLQQYLTAFHGLSPERQAQLRQLDRDLHHREHDEDVVTRARLYGVMEHYAGWLARLPTEERRYVESTPVGPERLEVVRELLEEYWFEGLPGAIADDPALVEKWRQDENERRTTRLKSLRAAEEAALLLPAMQQQKFRETVQKYVEETLEPQLRPNEKRRLENAKRGAPFAYFHTVLVLSEAHRLRLPGPREQWERFREPRSRGIQLPDG